MAVAERHVWEVGGKQGFPPAGTHRRNIMRGSPSLAHLNCQISISLFHTDSFISEIIPGINMITAPSMTTDDSRGIKKKKKEKINEKNKNKRRLLLHPVTQPWRYGRHSTATHTSQPPTNFPKNQFGDLIPYEPGFKRVTVVPLDPLPSSLPPLKPILFRWVVILPQTRFLNNT